MRCSTDLVQLMDAFLHAADGGHGSQGVGVELSEAVLPADLKEGHHRAFLPTDTGQSSDSIRKYSSKNLLTFQLHHTPPTKVFMHFYGFICSVHLIPDCKNISFFSEVQLFQAGWNFALNHQIIQRTSWWALVLEHMIVQK